MNEIIRFDRRDYAPRRDLVMDHQGLRPGRAVTPQIEELLRSAVGLLHEVARPAGLIRAVTPDDTRALLEESCVDGAGAPVRAICERSGLLALFAVTLGERVTQEIECRFRANQLALGAMLDSAASVAADALAAATERHFLEWLLEEGRADDETEALRYSPGYCGWHIGGQARLFAALQPERIGITLRPSMLMDPLKSVTGLIIAGPRHIHEFETNFPCCAQCETFACRERRGATRAALRAAHQAEKRRPG